MKILATALASTFLLSACAFVPAPVGVTAPAPALDAEPPASAEPTPVVEAEGAESTEEPAAPPPAPVEEVGTAGLCTKASTCTMRLSMELCGMLNPTCLDAFHKHVDGATREKCQEKLDRLPKLVEEYGKGKYTLPPECR